MDLLLVVMLLSQQGGYVTEGKDRAAARSMEQCPRDIGSIWVARWGREYIRHPVCTMQPTGMSMGCPAVQLVVGKARRGKKHPGWDREQETESGPFARAQHQHVLVLPCYVFAVIIFPL